MALASRTNTRNHKRSEKKTKNKTKMQRAAVPALHQTWYKRISHVIIAPIV